MNHRFKDCPKYDPNYKTKSKNEKSKQDKDEKSSEKDIKNNQVNDYDISCVAEDEANVSSTTSEWIIDCGATRHMTNNSSDFVKYNEIEKPRTVRFGGQEKSQGIGVGVLKITSIVNGQKLDVYLQDVLFVPILRRKLISLSAVTKHGCYGTFKSSNLTIIDKNGKPIITSTLIGGLYYANVEDNDHETIINDDEDDGCLVEMDNLSLWHQRMGHINNQYLLKTAKVVEGMQQLNNIKNPSKPIGDSVKCVGCLHGKQTKKSIPSRTSERAVEIGERIHIDIGGPVGADAIGQFKYYIIHKDEYSSFMFIDLMKSRNEAFDSIRRVVANITAATTKQVRYIISDCGSEFTSNRSKEYFLEKNIVHLKPAPFTPASNGTIERMNRTLLNGVRSLLYNKNVPMKFWGEAAKTFIYLLNRSVNINNDKTPFELFHGKPPRVDHLKIFDCISYVKTQTKKRSGYQKKVETRSIKSLFIGYDQFDFTYRVYTLDDKSIIVSRDVIFDEHDQLQSAVDYHAIDSLIQNNQNDSLNDVISDAELDDNIDESEDEADAIDCSNLIPKSYKEALESPDSVEWIQSMKEEFESLKKNKTWVLVDLPKGRKSVTGKWVFAIKRNPDGSNRYKARYVARGFTQRFGLDYNETFSPVVRMESIRFLLIIANNLNLYMTQIDIKTAFLYGNLKEDVYMVQPEGFVVGNKVCKLIKSIYGLKQASHEWNNVFTDFLKLFNLVALKSDTCIFVNKNIDLTKKNKSAIIICIYVDDGLIMSNNKKLMLQAIEHLRAKFEMRISKPETFVGLQITRNNGV